MADNELPLIDTSKIDNTILALDNTIKIGNLGIDSDPTVLLDMNPNMVGIGQGSDVNRVLTSSDLNQVKDGFSGVVQALSELGKNISVRINNPGFAGSGLDDTNVDPSKAPTGYIYPYEQELSKLKIGLKELDLNTDESTKAGVGFISTDIMIDIVIPPHSLVTDDKEQTISFAHGNYYTTKSGVDDPDGYEIYFDGKYLAVPKYKTASDIDGYSDISYPLINGKTYNLISFSNDGKITKSENTDGWGKWDGSYNFLFTPYQFITGVDTTNKHYGFRVNKTGTTYKTYSELEKNLTSFDEWKTKVANDYNKALDIEVEKWLSDTTSKYKNDFLKSTEYLNLITQFGTDKLNKFKSKNITAYYNTGVPGYASNGLQFDKEITSTNTFDVSSFNFSSYVATTNMVTAANYATANPSELDAYGNIVFENKMKQRTHYLTSYLTDIYVFVQNTNYIVKHVSERHFKMLTYIKTNPGDKFKLLADLLEAVPGDPDSFYFKGTYPFPWYRLHKSNKTSDDLDNSNVLVLGNEDINFQTLLSAAQVNSKLYEYYFKRDLLKNYSGISKKLDYGYILIKNSTTYYLEDLTKVKAEVDLISPSFITINDLAKNYLFDKNKTLAIETSVNSKTLFEYKKSNKYDVYLDGTLNTENPQYPLKTTFDGIRKTNYSYIATENNILGIAHQSSTLLESYADYLINLVNTNSVTKLAVDNLKAINFLNYDYYLDDYKLAQSIVGSSKAFGFKCEYQEVTMLNQPFDGVLNDSGRYLKDPLFQHWIHEYSGSSTPIDTKVSKYALELYKQGSRRNQWEELNNLLFTIDYSRFSEIVSILTNKNIGNRTFGEVILKITIPNIDVDDSNDNQDDFVLYIPIIPDTPTTIVNSKYKIQNINDFNTLISHYIDEKISISPKILTAFKLDSFPTIIEKNYVIKNMKLTTGDLKYYLANGYYLVMASNKKTSYDSINDLTNFRNEIEFIQLVDQIYLASDTGIKACYKPIFKDALNANIESFKSDSNFLAYYVALGVLKTNEELIQIYKFWKCIKEFYGV